MDIAMVAVDDGGRITVFDDLAQEWFGHEAAQVLGERVDVLVPHDVRERHWAGFDRVMAGGERHLEGATVNLPVLCGDGQVRAYPARFVHLDAPSGEPVGALALFTLRDGHEEPWTPVAGQDGGQAVSRVT